MSVSQAGLGGGWGGHSVCVHSLGLLNVADLNERRKGLNQPELKRVCVYAFCR